MKAFCKLQSSIQMQIIHSFGGNYYSSYYYYFHCEEGLTGETVDQALVGETQLLSSGSGALWGAVGRSGAQWGPVLRPALDPSVLPQQAAS